MKLAQGERIWDTRILNLLGVVAIKLTEIRRGPETSLTSAYTEKAPKHSSLARGSASPGTDWQKIRVKI